jgi:hypothetical protein
VHTGNEVVFISYRRAGAASAAEFIAKKLDGCFGAGTAFQDLTGLGGGDSFPMELRFALERSLVMIALVDRNWFAEFKRRAAQNNRADYVAEEIRQAKQFGIPIIPVLLEGSRMPSEEELPADLRFFATLHALPLGTLADNSELQGILIATARQSALPLPAAAGGRSKLPRMLLGAATSPAELLLRPKRFLLRSSRGSWRDFMRLVIYLAVSAAVVMIAASSAIGLPTLSMAPNLLSLVPFLVAMMLMGSLAFSLVVSTTTRLTTGIFGFSRMFLITAYVRGTLSSALLIGAALWMFWLGSEDHSLVVWKAELLRTESTEDMMKRVLELRQYADESTVMNGTVILGAFFAGLAIWSYFAWIALRATHQCGVILPLILIVVTLGLELLLPLALVFS